MTDPTPTPTFSLLRTWFHDSWKRVDKPRFTLTLQWALLVCLLACMLLIFLLGAQIRYEGLAAEAFRQREYEVAASRYLKALRFATVYGRPRYLYMVGLCYSNQKEWSRAGDFFMRLFKTYPDSSWTQAGSSHFERIIRETGPIVGVVNDGMVRAKTPLGIALQSMRANQKQLIESIRSVQKGDIRAADLERKYEAYKLAFESYNVELKRAWADVNSTTSTFEPQIGTASDKAELEKSP